MKKLLSILLVAIFLINVMPVVNANAATRLNKSKATLNVNESLQLRITGSGSTIKWTSSNKSVATVSSRGKVTAIAIGTTKIIANVSKKEYVCTIKVIDKTVDVILLAVKVDDQQTIEEYIQEHKQDFTDCLDVTSYDKTHIDVKMWESTRLDSLKILKSEIKSMADNFISNDEYAGLFIDIKHDDLLQNITLYVDGSKNNDINSFFTCISAYLSLYVISDYYQAYNLINVNDRIYNITLIDKNTGEIVYPVDTE